MLTCTIFGGGVVAQWGKQKSTYCSDSTPSTPLLSPFQLPVSFLPLKALVPKYPQWEVGQLFNTLQPLIKTVVQTSLAGYHRGWHTASLM